VGILHSKLLRIGRPSALMASVSSLHFRHQSVVEGKALSSRYDCDDKKVLTIWKFSYRSSYIEAAIRT
jgi:hypothetical protein